MTLVSELQALVDIDRRINPQVKRLFGSEAPGLRTELDENMIAITLFGKELARERIRDGRQGSSIAPDEHYTLGAKAKPDMRPNRIRAGNRRQFTVAGANSPRGSHNAR
jgi:hypothetical protein